MSKTGPQRNDPRKEIIDGDCGFLDGKIIVADFTLAVGCEEFVREQKVLDFYFLTPEFE